MAKTLKINVVDKIATYRRRGGEIVCGNSDYVIEFTFDAEWDAYPAKTARFIANGRIVADVVFEGTSAAVPVIQNAQSVAVGVFAGNLKTTTPAFIPCQKSILCEGGTPADPTPDVYNQIMDLLNNGGGGGGGSADISELEEDVETLKQQMANLLYTAISVSSFSHNAGTKEYGQTVSSVSLSWAINKTPTALTLDGVALDVSARSKALTGLSITKDNNKTWKLVATDERGAKSEKTTSISFCNGVYYGAGAAQDAYGSAFVLGLTKSLRSNKLSSVTVTAGEGEYIFYCLPKRMGACTFKVGGFEGGFELAATISFTNASGYTEDYYIYKSVNANLGKTTVSIS